MQTMISHLMINNMSIYTHILVLETNSMFQGDNTNTDEI